MRTWTAATRDRYRKVVEELALASGQREEEVATAAVTLARDASAGVAPTPETPSQPEGEADNADWRGFETPPGSHVGYYLVADGRETLEERLAVQLALPKRAKRWVLKHPDVVYVGASALLALFLVFGAAGYAALEGGSALLILLAAVVTLMPALAAAVALVDWVVTLAVPPRILPKLDLAEPAGGGRIPDSCRTLVVVPAMLTSAREVASLVQQIEQHYLRNPDHNLYFALLTDFADAPAQHLPGDAALLEQARAGISVLNARYGRRAGPRARSACSTVSDAGTRRKGAGSAGSANAASSTS